MQCEAQSAMNEQRAARFFEEMYQLHRIWGELRPMGPLHKGDLMVLGRMLEHEQHGKPPLTIGTLASTSHQTPPGISQKVSGLEKRGYVKREMAENDRRVVYITLTDKGRREASRTLAHFLGRIELAMDEMGDQKAEQLLDLVDELLVAIEKTRRPTEGPRGGKQS